MSRKKWLKCCKGDIFITYIHIRCEDAVHMSLAEVPMSVSWLGQP